MLISELLERVTQDDTIIAEPEIPLYGAAFEMSQNNIGALPVVDAEDNVVGVLSERDILKTIVGSKEAFFDMKVQDAMSASVVTCSLTDTARDVYETLCSKRIRHIPIAKNGKLVAMLSIRDFDHMHRSMAA